MLMHEPQILVGYDPSAPHYSHARVFFPLRSFSSSLICEVAAPCCQTPLYPVRLWLPAFTLLVQHIRSIVAARVRVIHAAGSAHLGFFFLASNFFGVRESQFLSTWGGTSPGRE